MLEFIEMTPFAEHIEKSYDVWDETEMVGMVIRDSEGFSFHPSNLNRISQDYMKKIVEFMSNQECYML